jgi:hypothetical protein
MSPAMNTMARWKEKLKETPSSAKPAAAGKR